MVGVGVYLVLALSSVLPAAAVAHGAGPDHPVCLAHVAVVLDHGLVVERAAHFEHVAGASTYDQAACDSGEPGESGQCDGGGAATPGGSTMHDGLLSPRER